jgi:hypothetical protein
MSIPFEFNRLDSTNTTQRNIKRSQYKFMDLLEIHDAPAPLMHASIAFFSPTTHT